MPFAARALASHRCLRHWALTLAAVSTLSGQQPPLLAEDRLRMPEGLPPAVDVVLADVNGDGNLDLVRVGVEDVDILLQTAAGEFEPHPLQMPLRFNGADLRAVSAGRFRIGATLPDLLLVRAAAAPVVLVNDGSGRFAVGGPLLPVPPVPVSGVLVGDLDHVPPDDLLVLPEQGRPQLLLGQAASYRDASQLLAVNLFVQAPVGALADFDGDGDLDVVLASRAGGVPFLLENNAGFQRQIALPLAGAYGALAVADFDGDRRVDVAVARSAPAPLAVEFALNRGPGFVAYSPPTPFPLDAPVTRLRAIDLTLDGSADLVLLQEDGRVRAALNDGLPAFSFRHLAPLLPAAPRSGLAVGDLEGDGDVDMVVAGGGRANSSVRDSVLLGHAAAPDWLDTEAIGFPIGVLAGEGVGAAVDFDGDGELDVVGYGPTGSGRAFRNDGTARFAEAAGVLPALAIREVRRVAVAAIDTPQRDLLVLASAAGGTAQPPGLRLLVNRAGAFVDVSARLPAAFAGGLADVVAQRVLLPTGGTRQIEDLIVADTAGNLAVLANSNGAFTAIPGAFAPAVAADPVRAIVTGDVDGDRLPDVVLVTFGAGLGGGVQIFLRSSGNTPPLFVEAPRPAVRFGVANGASMQDFDGDGNLDVLVRLDSTVASPLRLLAGNGAGDFVDATAATFTLPLPTRVDALASVNLPAQGRALLLGRNDGGPLVLLRRQGNRFGAAEVQPIHGSTLVSDLVVADFDTDGDDDCAVFTVDTLPGLLLGTDIQLAGRTVAQARRQIALRARGPDPAAVAAWLWSGAGTARLPIIDLGIVRLAPPITSLAVFPFGPTRTVDIDLPAPPVAATVTFAFQLAVFDPRTARVRLSNLEPLSLTPR